MNRKTFGCGLLMFAAGLALSSLWFAQSMLTGYLTHNKDSLTNTYYDIRTQILGELWLSEIIPGPLHTSCFTSDPATCRAAFNVGYLAYGVSIADYGLGLYCGNILLAFIGVFLFQRFQRRRARSATTPTSVSSSSAS